MSRLFVLLAALYGFTGVALGAFAAHGLRGRLSPEYLAVFHTGVLYQLVHALALLGVGALALHWRSRLLAAAGGLFAAGILLFSGSLYLLTLSSLRVGPVTPLGGVCLLAGWLCLGIAASRAQSRRH
ncbi:Uncharacterized membrane protein YgdD, TMEM256/DUF423 family [Geopseudomonas sagittaria]|uniref:Uncharacterized membrane protein YgdD, TMEM256/DUF423 family n=1 Tax=Geopseudomonas sagittaria TaxID=1135990 RepID=A0A1I5S857_9GAMM|nr:DUF423 domain-containing protein [Pseudomonas sagittaria]MCM2329998.1 DUF423 domain-containing protein [Pseudomonas sagittaria]SFP66436.1 Uncharacterized membrane protein YgdD, TMEM256/DUF423 family [Pseudomonas sagittaria]